jgi:hypothetical protein
MLFPTFNNMLLLWNYTSSLLTAFVPDAGVSKAREHPQP